MTPLVFAGPSLHAVKPAEGLVFDLAPPARCGDLARAVHDGRRLIGLIDGVFESGPAVWHKEILFALAAGCKIFGSASMGALRAAECADFGMIGIGRIFADYRCGRRTSDADVALTFAPAELGYMPLSVALVDVEALLEDMTADGSLDASVADALLATARQTFFKLRTWDRLLAGIAATPDVRAAIADRIATDAPGQKGRDAEELLRRICAESPPCAGRVAFQHTLFSSKLFAELEI